MKKHEFLRIWHHPNGDPNTYIEEFTFHLLPNNFSWNRQEPTSELQFRIECTVCAGIFPRIHEVVKSNVLQRRNADEEIEHLLDRLSAALSDRFQEVKNLGNVHPKIDKPVLTVIAGAGFSAGLGLPVTAEMRELIANPCKKPESLLHFLHEYELNEYPLKDFLAGSANIPDFEYLLTVWDGYRRQLAAVDERSESRHVQCLRRVIENVACHLYRLSWDSANTHVSQLDAFADWLKRAKLSHDVRFITFNYDVILEMVCKRAGFPFTYTKRRDPGEVPIRKLHGSINWQSYPGEASAPNVRMDLLYRTDQHCIYAFPDVKTCPYGSSGEMPVLIPPTANKEYRGVYEWMWAYAGLDIPAANKLLIVGYSFPPLDIFSERHLVPMLRKHSGSLTYVLPRCAALERVQHLLREVDVSFLEEKWRMEHFDALL